MRTNCHFNHTHLPRAAVAQVSSDDVVIGDANQAGEDCRNIALIAGLPVEVAAVTANRLCGSSAAAVLDAARALKLGEDEFMIAGGIESMSRPPSCSRKPIPRMRATSLFTIR